MQSGCRFQSAFPFYTLAMDQHGELESLHTMPFPDPAGKVIYLFEIKGQT
jgi:hypothetical protein